jgi:WD40 repeat protein
VKQCGFDEKMATENELEEEDFFDAFDPDLRPLDDLHKRSMTNITEPPTVTEEGISESLQNGLGDISTSLGKISTDITSRIPFASREEPGEEGGEIQIDFDDLVLDLTPFLNEEQPEPGVRSRTRSVSRPSSYQPAVETIEETEAADTESENPVPSQGLPETRESFDQLSSDKDSSVPSVADTNSESSGKSLFSRFRRAVAVNFSTTSPSKFPPSESGDFPPLPLAKTPKTTATSLANGIFGSSFFAGKSLTIFDRLKETQVLNQGPQQHHRQAIWVTTFSLDGKYLATGGRDGRVVVWSVGIDRRGVSDQDIHRDGLRQQEPPASMDDETQAAYESSPFPLLYPLPCRVYRDHTDDITDLSWTRRHFLLSASADKTVRLWNVKRSVPPIPPSFASPLLDSLTVLRAECLQKIDHPDVLTAVQFHPTRERFFVSACFDGLVRVWDLLKEEKTEIASAEVCPLPPILLSLLSLFPFSSTRTWSQRSASVPTAFMWRQVCWTASCSSTRRRDSSTTPRSPARARAGEAPADRALEEDQWEGRAQGERRSRGSPSSTLLRAGRTRLSQ